MIHPAAAYDALAIVEGLSPDFDTVLDSEVHTLTYLAFLLSLSDGAEPERWGYGFVATKSASPFSAAVNAAIIELATAGLLLKRANRLSPAASAPALLRSWRALPGNRERCVFLEVALAAARAISLPLTVRAVQREPQLSRATELDALRALPDELGLLDLLSDFRQVDGVLFEQGLSAEPERHQALLLSRAHLWLSYLAGEPDPARTEAEGTPSLA